MGTQAEFIQFLFGCNTFFYHETRKSGRTKRHKTLWDLKKKIKKDKKYKEYTDKVEKIDYTFENFNPKSIFLGSVRERIFNELELKRPLLHNTVIKISNKGVIFKYDSEWDGYGEITIPFRIFKEIRLELEIKTER